MYYKIAQERKSNEKAKKTITVLEESKKDLETRVDTLQARLTLSEDTLAKERAELKKKIEEAEDKSVDMA